MFRGIVLAIFFLVPAALSAREEIIDYHSEIVVQRDGLLDVTETIRVRAEGRQIRRGIFRDFPTRYKNADGTISATGFDVLEVRRDGAPEPWFTERQSNGTRLYIGARDVSLSPGVYTYIIHYTSPRQLRHFEAQDELYWNVTGTDWAFPILQASARVILPPGAEITGTTAYTGAQGERGQDFSVTYDGEASARFETTRPLRPQENISIVVAWPPGFVDKPTAMDEAGYLLSDNIHILVGALGLGAVFVYFLVMWVRVGRDPEKGAIIARYEPPAGFSPAACHFVSNMGFSNTAFTAAIVNMAVKGYLIISEDDDKDYTLTRTGKDAGLSKGEQTIASRLLSYDSSIKMEQKNHTKIRGARKALERALGAEFEENYFRRNRGAYFTGFGLAILAILGMALLSPQREITIFMSIWLAGWSFGVYALLVRVKNKWVSAFSKRSLAGGFGALFATLFALPFVAGMVIGLVFFSASFSIPAAVLTSLILFVTLSFYHLLKAPTRLGRRIMDEIEGFKLYLSVAESDRMRFFNPPEKTPELFEKYLPYAIALGVEDQWGGQFEDVLAAASLDPGRRGGGYHPGWYHSRGGFSRGFQAGSFASGLGAGFSSAIASAATSPSKGGSGFSGGGFSGGGGGGGGGGGW